MRNLLFFFLGLLSLNVNAQSVRNRSIMVVYSINDLKSKPVTDSTIYYLVGKTAKGDNLGATFTWNSTSTATEDLTYLNVIAHNTGGTGRFERVNIKTIQLPHGVLTMNSGKKEFFTTNTINASSETLTYLTYENTATGTPIFTDLWSAMATPVINAATANDVITSCIKVISSDLKQITFKFAKGNTSVISLLGVNVISLTNATTGTSIKYKFEGY